MKVRRNVMKKEVTYKDTTILVNSYCPKVSVIWSTPDPAQVIANSCSTTQKGPFAALNSQKKNAQSIVEYVLKANHTSVLEHAVISFHITNISRAILDQLVRHRMGSFTASSTHYQDHTNYEHFVDILSFNIPNFLDGIAQCVHLYKEAVKRDTQTARQILPLSVGVAVNWTVNARSLINFLNLRLCRRNTVEMVILARFISIEAQNWFPECFNNVHEDCLTSRLCQQGSMRCDDSSIYRINSNTAALL